MADNGTGIDGNGSDASVAEALADALGERTLAFTDSVASPEAAVQMVKMAQAEFGGVDIIVNCAAILRDALVFKGPPADWDTLIRNNLSAAYYLTHGGDAVDAPTVQGTDAARKRAVMAPTIGAASSTSAPRPGFTAISARPAMGAPKRVSLVSPGLPRWR